MTSLARVPTAELRRLLRAIEHGALSVPLREAELRAEGLPAAELLHVLASLERGPLVRVVAAFVADRDLRPPPHLDLVWTGPEARGAVSRDTAVLVRELFAQAARSVVIAGFSFDHGKDIFAPLHEGMRARGVTTDVFLDIRDAAPPGVSPGEHARAYVTTFLGRNWSFGPPFPRFYFDPRSAEHRARASLHAKCIVVDVQRTLVTSANFTDRGQTRNIELGALIDDPEFAARVVAQWRSLVDGGHLVEIAWA
jgi:hypothetical protein